MNDALYRLIVGAVLAAQFALGLVFFTRLLQPLAYRRPRWVGVSAPEDGGRRSLPAAWMKWTGISPQRQSYIEREALLAGCGFTFDPALYMLARLAALTACAALGALALAFPAVVGLPGMPPASLPAACFAAMCAGFWDKPLLEAFRRYRSQRIMREIYAVSNQLLYFEGSSLHIHVKLMRCVPYTSVIRGDLLRLLGEWYHDAEDALRRFKQRLGTAEGASFVETIDALRLHEDEAYYELLRDRIADYKAKLELIKESRKESASYGWFILAGLPILYMFQIFIYPWVQEGQKLFQSLNS